MAQQIDDRLLKIVALAKFGVAGERETADRMVRSMCAKLELEYSDVMADESDTYVEHVLPVRWRNKAELRVLAQVCWCFADTGDERVRIAYNILRKVVFVTTTPAKFIETSQAAVVYLAAFRKAKRLLLSDLPGAFISKHHLYSEYPDDDNADRPAWTDEQRMQHWRQAQLVETMESVRLHKAITGSLEQGAANR